MSSGSNDVKPLFSLSGNKGETAKGDSISSMGEVDSFSNDMLDELKLVYPGMAGQAVLNVFRGLRTRLMKASGGKNFSCLVTSVCSKGGASHIVRNLGAAISLDKSKTSLLIDANLYNPSLADLVIGEPEQGLTDYLSETESGLSIKDIVYATGVPRMRVIPLGGNGEAAAEYFSSRKMVGFAEEICKRYSDRFIFFDSPPLLEASETQILFDIVDFVLLVVPYGRATHEQVEEAIEKIDRSKLVGIVYNH